MPTLEKTKPRSIKKRRDSSFAAPNLRDTFGLTRPMLARMTGLSERTLASWEAGISLHKTGQRAVTGVQRLLQALAEVIKKEAIAGWLDAPNSGFDGLKPIEVMERGETDRLWRMIFFLGSGVAS